MEHILSLSEAKAKLNSLVENIEQSESEYILTKKGRPVAVLVSADFFEGYKETKEIQSNPMLIKEIQMGIKKLKKGGKRYTFEDVFGDGE